MMRQSKTSLFKQKIKEARKQQDSSEHTQPSTFPTAIKISFDKQSLLVDSQHDPVLSLPLETVEEEPRDFVRELLRRAMKEEEIREVEAQNMKSIESMKPEQIKKYQEMIKNEMPSGFVQKILKKSPPSLMKDPHLNPKSHEADLPAPTNHQPPQQSKPSANFISPQQPTRRAQYEDTLPVLMSSLGIDIKRMKLDYQHSESPTPGADMKTILDLKTMVESQNNQTQIVGCSLLEKCLNELERPARLPLIKVQQVPIHYLALMEGIIQLILPSLLHQAKRTKFYTCWRQLMATIISTIRWYLTGRAVFPNWYPKADSFAPFINFLESQMEVGWMQEQNDSQMSKMISSVISEIKCFSLTSGKVDFGSFQDLLEIIYIEIFDLQLEQFQESQNPLKLRSTLRAVFESGSEEDNINVAFQVCLQLKKRELKANRTLTPDREVVKIRLYEFLLRFQRNHYPGQQMDSGSKFLLPTISSLPAKFTSVRGEQLIFKKLYIMKTLCPTIYIQYLRLPAGNGGEESSVSQVIQNDALANFITLLNTFEYFSAPQPYQSREQFEQEVDNIENMLLYLGRVIEEEVESNGSSYLRDLLPVIFADLLVIFGSSESSNFETELILSYRSINQSVLNSTFAKLCSGMCSLGLLQGMWELITSEQVKTVLESYNFNSFGHYTFTRLLIFLLASCDSVNLQGLIIDETVSRYPFLFFFATEREEFFGAAELYTEGRGGGSEEKKRILEVLKTGNRDLTHNYFCKYLMRC